MKTGKYWTLALAAALLAGQALAQTEQVPGDAGTADAQAREAELVRRMEEAERKMSEAAREIAELTSERLPHVDRRIEIMKGDRPRLGVTIGDEGEGPVEGVRILGVTPGSAADDAGLRTGDILTAINKEPLSADSAKAAVGRLMDFMEGVEQGDVLDIEYLRDGKVGTVNVEPRAGGPNFFAFGGGDPGNFTAPMVPNMNLPGPGGPSAPGPNVFFSWVGNAWGDMELVELNEGLGKYFGTDKGVLVVKAPTTAGLQLQDGDVIQSIDGREPTSVRHAIRILSSYQPGEKLKLGIMREKRGRTLDVEMPDNRSSQLEALPAPAARPAATPAPAALPYPPASRT